MTILNQPIRRHAKGGRWVVGELERIQDDSDSGAGVKEVNWFGRDRPDLLFMEFNLLQKTYLRVAR